MGLPR
jgi:hypothetical protein